MSEENTLKINVTLSLFPPPPPPGKLRIQYCLCGSIKEIWQCFDFEGKKKAAFVKDFNVYCTTVCGRFIYLYLMSNNLQSKFNEGKTCFKQKTSALN